MAKVMHRRGPDGHGWWVDEGAGLVLAHNRLAIRDRSAAGSQPMLEPSKCSALVFNGEIDNHRSWRDELTRAGHRLGHLHPATGRVEHSSSDTESLLHALHHWGPSSVCRQSQGMWAWGWYERDRQRLTLSRDRIGKKPLYWLQAEWGVAFASQLQAFRCLPMYTPSINQRAVAHYLRWGFIEGPDTLLNDVHRVEPGQIITIEQGRGVSSEHYWTINDEVVEASRSRVEDPPVAQAELLRTLELAISDRMSTDVATGAFLSGGIDSACVVAAMRHAGVERLCTFTAGFDHPQYDERPAARAVAEALGTEHTEVMIPDADLPALAEDAVTAFDQPFADGSAIATLAVSRVARGSVGVALSGDGGDELFGGYERHLRGFALSRWVNSVPLFARTRIADAIEMAGGDAWEGALRPLEPVLPAALRRTQRGRLMHKVATILRARDDEALWRAFFAAWPDPASAIPQLPADMWEAAVNREAKAMPCRFPRDEDGFFDELLLRDQSIYLPDDILVKLDRCSMECGLEARDPMLDLRLFQFAWRIPPAWRTDGTVGKLLLRDFLRHRLPASAHAVAARPKQGFGVPLRAWFDGPLRSWADEVLDPRRVDAQGILDGRAVRARLDRARAGAEGAAQQAWAAICVTRWCEREGLDGSRVARVNR